MTGLVPTTGKATTMARISKGALLRQAKAQRHAAAAPYVGSEWPKRLVVGFFIVGALLMFLPKGTNTYVATAEDAVQPAVGAVLLFCPARPEGIDI